MATQPVQIVTTIDSKQSAEKLVSQLVEENLVACGQIDGPIRSIYRWQGVVEKAAEYRCILKTDLRLIRQLEQRIRELHDYAVPEIVATDIVFATEDYLRWLDQQLLPEQE